MSDNELVKVGGQLIPAEVAEIWKTQQAEDAQISQGSGIPQKLSIRGGIFASGEEELGVGPLYFWILARCRVNAYYDPSIPFDPKNPQNPLCFTMYADKAQAATAAPHEQSERPQCESCINCPHDAWGSAKRRDGSAGKGKACQNRWRLALLPALTFTDGKAEWAPPDYLSTAPFYALDLPVTSGKPFEEYTEGMLKATKRPGFAYASALTIKPHKDFQQIMQFDSGNFIPDDPAYLGVLTARHLEAKSRIQFPFFKAEKPAEAMPVAGEVKF